MNKKPAFVKTVRIGAPPDRVFRVMTDVERWPEWTSSVTSVRRIDPGPLQIGSRARIKQPRLLPAVWTVRQLEPERGFTWESRTPGLRVSGGHYLEPNATATDVTLSVDFEGPLAAFATRIFRGLNERYLSIEAAGLKRRCEEVL